MSHAAPGTSPDTGYIRPIDGLRAIAVLAVMLYHLRPSWLPGGFTGVDVFFVISGYVVSASLHRDAGRGLAGFLAGFYARRLLRLLPALLACLLATALLATLFIPDAWLSQTSERTALHAFFGLSNFALADADDYFSPRTEYNPYAHTWSLGVEEQFYLLFPLLLFAWARWRDRAGGLRFLALALLPLTMAASWAFAIQIRENAPQQAFYLLPSRFWELAAGALLFQWTAASRPRKRLERWLPFALPSGLVLVMAGLAFAGPEAFPLRWGPILVAGTALVLLGVTTPIGAGTLPGRFLASPPLAYLGKISYSLYLWHWPVFVLLRWTLGLEGTARASLAVLLSFALAMLSYHLLEQPLRQSRWLRRWPGLLVIGIAVVAAMSGWKLARTIFDHRPSLSLSVTRDAGVWQPYPRNWPPGSLAERCHVEIDTRHDASNFFQRHSPLRCEAPARRPRRIFAIGDSHALSYAPLFYRLGVEEGVTTTLYARAGCTFANLKEPQYARSVECSRFIEHSLAEIARDSRPGDVLFMAALRVPRLVTQSGDVDTDEGTATMAGPLGRANRNAALRETARLLEPFRSRGLHLLIDLPKPVFRQVPFRCSDWFNRGNRMCRQAAVSRAELQALMAPAQDSISRLQEAYTDLSTWDPFPVLCPGDPCLPHDGDGPLFYDGDHLSAHGNHLLYPSFLARLEAIWEKDPSAR